MTTYTIHGPSKLSGTVHVQGAKNSAMKHVFMPFLAKGKFRFDNIPKITSVENLLQINSLFSVKSSWHDNCLDIDSSNLTLKSEIPAKLFYHTSGAVQLIPVLTNLSGECIIEGNNRDDPGGDQIGRTMDNYHSLLNKIGITFEHKNNRCIYHLSDTKNFDVTVNNQSYGESVMMLLAALGRLGSSRIRNITQSTNFYDTINILQKMGANLSFEKEDLVVQGQSPLLSVDYQNMGDQHDLASWVAIALTTESEISIEGVDYQQMQLQPLETFLHQIDAKNIDLHSSTIKIPQILRKDLLPTKILAADYPNFITEWQVLFSPLLAQINGESQVVEGWYVDRMRHWLQLQKMGASYEFFSHPDYPEKDGLPRAVKINGKEYLYGAEVEGHDLRTTAALIIAGLSANGKTVVLDQEDNLKRGYENLPQKLISLGANIYI